MDNGAPHYFKWRLDTFDDWASYVLDEVVIWKDVRTTLQAKLTCEFLLSMCSGELEEHILNAMNERRYVYALQQIIKLRFSFPRIMLKNE